MIKSEINEDLSSDNFRAPTKIQRVWKSMKFHGRRNPTMAVGIVVFLIVVVNAAAAPLITTVDPYEAKPFERLTPPSSEYWFGSDFIGRDVFSRVTYGGRISLFVGVTVSTVTTVLAIVLGLFCGYYKWIDLTVMRVLDGIMAIPLILLAIALMALLGGSVTNVVFALVVVETPRCVRIMRSSVLSIKEEMYVDASRGIGASEIRILFRHILPNCFAPMIVIATFILAEAILIEAILTFLGAGTPIDVPSWGSMMSEARRAISVAIWVIAIPGTYLSITVLAINLAGDGLRDILDPKLARRL